MNDPVLFVVGGLYLGSLIAFVALGYSLVYGVLRFVNFAHGEIIAFSGLVVFQVKSSLAPNCGLLLGILIAALTGAVCGVLMDRLVYRNFRGEGSLVLLLASFAVSMALQGGMSAIWGSHSRNIGFGDPVVEVFGTTVYARQLWLPALGLIGLFALEYLLRHTIWGLVTRGYSSNPVQMSSSGAPVGRTITMTFALSGALAGIASVVLGLGTGVSPLMGFQYALWAFAATIIGGLGSLRGTIIGGLLLGMVLTAVARFGSPLYMDATAFIVMTGVLIWRPRGLFAFLERKV